MNIAKLIREKLELTQEELAEILQIKRSQLSLYELGLRGLPLKANSRFDDLIAFSESRDSGENKNKSSSSEQELEKNKFLAELLEENKFQQINCSRKMAFVEEKYNSASKKLEIISFVEGSSGKSKKLHPGALLMLKDKFAKVFEKNGLKQLTELQIKLQVLQYEESLIKEMQNK